MRGWFVVFPVLASVALIANFSAAQDYTYVVEGYSEEGYVYGEVAAWRGSSHVEGYVYTEDGDTRYFSGEWLGSGEVEGYDEEGNYLILETELKSP